MYLNLSRLVLRHFPTGRMNGCTGLLAFGAERNQGAVVNCRFDPTLHGQGVTLRKVLALGQSSIASILLLTCLVFTRPRSPLVGLDRRGFDAGQAIRQQEALFQVSRLGASASSVPLPLGHELV